MSAIAYYSGIDLGQTQDPTALAVLERSPVDGKTANGRPVHKYDVRHLERFKLGTNYVEIVARVGKLFDAPPLAYSYLGVDETGVGRPVLDMLLNSKIKASLRPILITSGHNITHENGSYHVPKKELASVLQVLLQSRRIKVASTLPEAATLVRELENFKVKITLAASETYEAWREGMHDDLVLAVAIAAWLGENVAGLFRPEDTAAIVSNDPQLAKDAEHFMNLLRRKKDTKCP